MAAAGKIRTVLMLTLLFGMITSGCAPKPSPPPTSLINPNIALHEESKHINPGTVQLYLSATDVPKGVTSVVMSITDFYLRKRQYTDPSQTSPEYLAISQQSFTYDLIQISGKEQFMGTSEASYGNYTGVGYTIEKVRVALEDGQLQDVGFSVPGQATAHPSRPPVVTPPGFSDWSVEFIERPFEVKQGETIILVIRINIKESVKFKEEKVSFFYTVDGLEVRGLP